MEISYITDTIPALAERQANTYVGMPELAHAFTPSVSGFILPAQAKPLGRLPIHQWAEDDQPREKMMAKGRDAVSDAELLGILLGTGTAQASAVDLGRQMLAMADGQLLRMAQLEWRQLKAIKGVGDAKAITIAAALELGRRMAAATPAPAEFVHSSAQVYRVVSPLLTGLQQEQFWVLLLSAGNQILRKVRVSTGGITSVLADVRIIFREALLECAPGMVLVHNHPSGRALPSPEDDRLTKRLAEAGVLMDIRVTDHIIFTDTSFYSYKDEGRI